jgi:phage shock protein A
MFDLNTIIAQALAQAVEQATKPLITRIERLEAQAIAENTATEDHDLLHRLDRRVDKLESQAEDAITANQINSLIEDALSEIDWEEQVREVLDQHDIADQIDEKIEEALSQLKIVRQ